VIVAINNKQVTFQITAVRLYHADDITVIAPPAKDRNNVDSDDDFTPIMETPVPKRKRGRPPGSKNKRKINQVVTATAHLNQRERDDLALAKKLRAAGKITTPGQPFEASTMVEIDALIT